MKIRSALILLMVFLAGCAGQVPTPQRVEVTRQVEVTRPVQVTRQVEVTRIVTGTPEPTRMFFPTDCLTRQPGLDFTLYDSLYSETIGGCSFLAASPDGKTLAFSAMTCLENAGECGEAVKVLKVGDAKPLTIAFSPASALLWVGYLGWSSTGELVFDWNSTTGGVGTYIVEPVFLESLVSRPVTARLVPGGLFQWNSSKTAFVTYFTAYERSCDNQLSGYDLTSGKLFPDIPAALGLNDTYVRIMPIDSNLKDSWDTDTQIDLLITPLEYDYAKQDYMFLPTLAGRITLSTTGPVYTTLGSGTGLNFYFAGAKGSRTVESTPYTVQYCHGG